MKLIIVIMTALMVQVSAAGFAQKITFVKKNASLEQIFNEIRKQTGYDVLWLGKDLDVAQKINADFRQAGLDEVMQKSLADLKLSYTIEDKNIVIKKMPPSFLDRLASVIVNDDGKFADIRGVVRNERGEALEGITVMVKGAKSGTRTNAKGEFILKGVKKGDVLVFTGVAIEPFEYTVKDDKNIDLNLKARLVQLEEVGINTGYQKISKERYVGSYSQLDSAAFHRRAGMGILERLDGTVTGVLFNKKVNSSYDGAIQIRGLSTLNSDQSPLIVLDNFPYDFDLSTINPNDVENITVLKDAAATSIWGARAGNGVIVITTKKGNFNQLLNISLNSNVNIQTKPNLYYYPQISSSDYIDFEQDLFSKGAYDDKLNNTQMPEVSPVVDILNKIRTGATSQTVGAAQIDKFRSIDFRDQLSKYVYQQKVIQQHHLNLNGGTGAINYQLSVGYNQIRPEIQNSRNDNQYTVSSNITFKVGKKIIVNTGVNLGFGNQKSVKLPEFPAYTYTRLMGENGMSMEVPKLYRVSFLDTVGGGKLLDWQFRPLDEIKLANQNVLANSTRMTARLNYAAKSWLNLSISGQYNLSNTDTRNEANIETFETRNLINRFTNLRATDPRLKYPVPIGGLLDLQHQKANRYDLRGEISINKGWKDHQLSMMMAGDFSEGVSSFSRSRFFGYQSSIGSFNGLIDYSNVYSTIFGVNDRIPVINTLGDKLTNRLISLTANASYSFKNKYTIYTSARRDGSNIFGVNTNNKWKPLWSVGGAWKIDEEKFFRTPWIDQLNLRATYGYSGNMSNGVPGLLTIIYSTTPSTFTGLPYASVGNPPNPNLRWEEVRMSNFTIDFSILKNRASGNFQYYRKSVKDLISNFPFGPSTGVQTQTVNGARLKGDGFDLNLSVKILDQRLKWNVDYGLSYAKMKVAEVYRPAGHLTSYFLDFGVNPAVGQLAYGLASYRWGGLDPQNGDPRGYLNGEISKDYNNLSIDSLENQVFHGSSIPLYSGFLSNRFSWKNLSFSFNVAYKLSFYFRKPAINLSSPTSLKAIPVDYNLRWQKPGDEEVTNVPSFAFPTPNPIRDQFYAYSDINVFRGDHVRLQDARLDYNLQLRRRDLSFIKNLNLFCYVNNLNVILWKKNNANLDPDFVGIVGGSLLSPPTKSFAIGLSANL